MCQPLCIVSPNVRHIVFQVYLYCIHVYQNIYLILIDIISSSLTLLILVSDTDRYLSFYSTELKELVLELNSGR